MTRLSQPKRHNDRPHTARHSYILLRQTGDPRSETGRVDHLVVVSVLVGASVGDE
jgi:hypothetical protein